MRFFAVALPVLLLAGCVQPTQRVRVAPAVAVIDAEPATPAGNPLVGGGVMPVGRTIGVNLAGAPNLSVLVRAMQAAGLTATLAAPGQLTLFAPTDEAFGRMAPGTVDALLKPENRASLVKLLDLHLLPERLSSAELVRRVRIGGGHATLATVAGEPLTVSMAGDIVMLTDSGGNRSYVETADVRQANGVVHVVNGVLVPRLK